MYVFKVSDLLTGCATGGLQNSVKPVHCTNLHYSWIHNFNLTQKDNKGQQLTSETNIEKLILKLEQLVKNDMCTVR